MIIYIFLLIIPLLFHFYFFKNKTDRKYKKIIFWTLAVLFTIISAIRYNVGTDYLNTYGTVLNWLKIGYRFDYEFLFLLLNRFIILINANIVLLMAICSFFTIPLFFRFIQKNIDEKYWFLGIFLFIGTTTYYATMNLVRQYMAIAILTFSFEYLKEKKYLKYILGNFLAMLFHMSSVINLLVFIVLYLWKKDKCRILFIIGYLLSLILIFVDARNVIKLFAFILPQKYIGYLDSPFLYERNILAVFKLIVPNILLLIMYYCSKKRKDSYFYNILFSYMFMYILMSNAFYGINIFYRLSLYYEFYMIISIPYLIELFQKEKLVYRINWNKKSFKFYLSHILTYGVIVYFCLLNVYSIFYKGGHGVVPYQTIWTDNRDEIKR